MAAGDDLLLFANRQVYEADVASTVIDQIVGLVQAGTISEAQIDRSVARLAEAGVARLGHLLQSARISLNASAAFNPPKPKEVERIALKRPSTGPGTTHGTCSDTAGSVVARFTVPGAQPRLMARAQIVASIAPDAPSG